MSGGKVIFVRRGEITQFDDESLLTKTSLEAIFVAEKRPLKKLSGASAGAF